jgi:ribosomal protein S27AE
MPRVTAVISSDSRNARRLTRSKMMEHNPEPEQISDANIRRKPEFFVYIYNVSQIEQRIARPWAHPNLVIPACEPDEPYGQPAVLPDIVQDRIDRPGSWDIGVRGVDGRFLAQDAIHPDLPGTDWKTYKPVPAGNAGSLGTDLYALGVWWSTNNPPTEEEVKTARDRLAATYRQQIQVANRLQMAGKSDEITPLMHRAADFFDLDLAWHTELTARQVCPGCGEKVPASMARHMPREKCGYVFDWNAALRSGVATKKEADEAGVMLGVEEPEEFVDGLEDGTAIATGEGGEQEPEPEPVAAAKPAARTAAQPKKTVKRKR